jgi:tetratricopeptide (TPR) repeat protein
VSKCDPGGVAHVVAWAFQWKPTEALTLLGQYYTADYRAEGIRYELEAVSGDDPVLPPPGNAWCEAERFVSWGLLVQGRLNELLRMLPPEEEWPPRSYYGTPHPLWALVWRGELTRARDLLEQVPLEIRERAHRDHWHHFESWFLHAEGNFHGALDAALEATGHSYRTRFGWEPCFNVAVARAMLSLGNTDDALAILMDAVAQSRRSGQAAYAEWSETFLGLSLLKLGRLDLK